MTILILLVVCISNILCFYIGALIGNKVSRGEELRLPRASELAEEKRDRRAAREKQERIDVIMRNIDAYDGTGFGQRDVPGGGDD